jgi:creatinine amidohydrolase
MRDDPVSPPRRWCELTAPDVAQIWPDANTDVGILPVGATEQHGPHLPTGTDTILAGALADAVSARTGAVVLPPIPIGCSYGHGTHIPGTLSLTPEHLTSTVLDVIEWAAHSGLRRVLVINTHYGNAASLGVASDHLRFHRPDLRIGIVDWWSVTEDLRSEATMDAIDLHANRAETSLMLAVAPHLVRTDLAATADDMDRTTELVFRYTASELSTNGVTGRPSEATQSLGEDLLERIVTSFVDKLERGRRENPPLRRPTSGRDCDASSGNAAGGTKVLSPGDQLL